MPTTISQLVKASNNAKKQNPPTLNTIPFNIMAPKKALPTQRRSLPAIMFMVSRAPNVMNRLKFLTISNKATGAAWYQDRPLGTKCIVKPFTLTNKFKIKVANQRTMEMQKL